MVCLSCVQYVSADIGHALCLVIPSTAQLLSNKSLKHLFLLECGLGDDAICSLVKGIVQCKLKNLALKGTHFTETGITILNKALVNHRTLKKELVQWS